jgi:hypothetical protein
VIVLEEGEVTQSGTHEELMQTDGHYQEIAAAQLHGDEEDEAADTQANPSHIKRMRDEKLVADIAGGVREEEEI